MTVLFSKVEDTGGVGKDSFNGKVDNESLTKEVERNGQQQSNLSRSWAVK